MGHTARETKKGLPLSIRLTEDLEKRIDRVWRSGFMKSCDKTQFIQRILEIGIMVEEGTEEIAKVYIQKAITEGKTAASGGVPAQKGERPQKQSAQ